MHPEHGRRSVLSQPVGNPNEIVITRTKLPVLRAGMGLLILPMPPILGVLFYMFGRGAAHSVWVACVLAALGAAFGLLYFATVAARISTENGAVRILRPLDEVVFPDASTKDWRLRTLSIWREIVVCVWRKERPLPIIAHFVVADTTSAGDLHSTAAALKKLLSDAQG